MSRPMGSDGTHTGSRVLSATPVVLDGGDRGVDLRVRVSAPADGTDLPVILFSHGFGSSGDLYQPLAECWAAHGFVVLQPTYLDSRRYVLDDGDPRAPRFWRYRIDDAVRVLDHLTTLTGAVPGLATRVDHANVAAAGHSFGGRTTALLLGLRVLPPADGGRDRSDPRVRAGVLLATAGRGGDDLAPGMIDDLPWLNVDFAHMPPPVLVVFGDRDQSVLTRRGPDWAADPFHLAPSPKSLLTVRGAEHSLGGAVGYDSFETTDADTATVGLLQRLTTAYLRTAVDVYATAWPCALADLQENDSLRGFVISR